ncbi:MAG: hypothetical protein K9M45_06215 [Kiritimatiellales bacterium]|nr:hypothetical protein [Kiritimatiellales bacterium]
MHPMKTQLLKAAMAAILFLPALGRADLRLDFDVILVKEYPIVEGHRKREMNDYRLTVFLGEDYIEYRDPDDSRVIDFRNRKIYDISLKEQNYSSGSLYAEVAFRVRELPSRLQLDDMLGKQGLVEHLFALRAPESRDPEVSTRHGRREYSSEGYPLMDMEEGGYELTVEEAILFGHFLRYHTGVHPAILADLEAVRRIAPGFDLYRYDLNNVAYNFRFVAAEEVERSFRTANNLAGLPVKSDELSALRVKAGAGELKTTGDALKATAVERADNGHMLESFLLFLEYTLATGEQMPPEFSRLEQKIAADPDVRLLVAAINPDDREKAQPALERLRSLSAKAGSGIRALMIVQANLLNVLGEREMAKQTLLQVLSENPCIPAAWKDLGDIYYAEYDTEHAWQCWDAGRGLSPGHKLFGPVNELEKKLEAEHPEFFLHP